MGDRCCLVHGGAGEGRREGAVVVILVRVAWCALVALGVACRGPTRDRAERAPAIRAVAPADTAPRSLNLYAAAGAGMLSPAARRQRLDFRDAHTLALVASVPVECRGVDHMEFTADGRYALATCEFSGQLLKLDLATRQIVGYLLLDPDGLGPRAMPQDIRSAPDGRVFYVADMMANGVFLVDPAAFRRIGFIATGKGTHGIYPSRDGRLL